MASWQPSRAPSPSRSIPMWTGFRSVATTCRAVQLLPLRLFPVRSATDTLVRYQYPPKGTLGFHIRAAEIVLQPARGEIVRCSHRLAGVDGAPNRPTARRLGSITGQFNLPRDRDRAQPSPHRGPFARVVEPAPLRLAMPQPDRRDSGFRRRRDSASSRHQEPRPSLEQAAPAE